MYNIYTFYLFTVQGGMKMSNASNFIQTFKSKKNQVLNHLLTHSGFTNANLFSGSNKGSNFFQSYQDSSPLNRAISIVTGPLVSALMVPVYLLEVVYFIFEAVVNLVFLHNINAAKTSIGDGVTSLFVAGVFAVATALNPIINLIDLIGGAFASLEFGKSNEPAPPNYNDILDLIESIPGSIERDEIVPNSGI